MSQKPFKIQLETRTKEFSIALINFLKTFPFNGIDQVIAKQILRSATSIGANYREANRAESKKDFTHKIGIIEKEASETKYWLELIESTWHIKKNQTKTFQNLLKESTELLALYTTISRNSKRKEEMRKCGNSEIRKL